MWNIRHAQTRRPARGTFGACLEATSWNAVSVARSIYITSTEGDSGKSTVALGITAALTRSVGKVGIFRPVARVADGSDYVVQLLLAHEGVDLTYEECVGVTYEDVHADAEQALATIVARYHDVARRCDVVVIVGTDYTDVSGAAEFEFNARIAANLGGACRARGARHRPHARRRSRRSPSRRVRISSSITRTSSPSSPTAATPSNSRRSSRHCPQDIRMGALPEDPILDAPLVSELAAATGAEFVSGDRELLSREARSIIIGAMTTEHLLDRLEDSAVVITAADRDDALLALLSAHSAGGFPGLAGIILTGGFKPAPSVARLVEGLRSPLPVLRTSSGTFKTATRAYKTRGRLTRDSRLKVDTALAMFERHVDADALLSILDVAETDVVTPLMFEFGLIDRARSSKRRIVLPEGGDDRILRAAARLLTREVCDITLLGDEVDVHARAAELGLDLGRATVISPADPELVERFAAVYAEARAAKGVTLDQARDQVQDVSYFGTMMVREGLADGMVSGAAHTTAHTITPSFQVIKTRPGVSIVSSVFFMCLDDRVLVYGDCAVNPDPTAEQLADIAISVSGDRTPVPHRATRRDAVLLDGRIGNRLGCRQGARGHAVGPRAQAGPRWLTARCSTTPRWSRRLRRAKAPDSPVAGRATVLVFPDLNTGNNTYKAVQRSAGAVAVGPVLQGLRKPVNDLSRGATRPGHRQYGGHHGDSGPTALPGRQRVTSLHGLVLVLNCGSSSIKYQVIDTAVEEPLAVGLVERVDDHAAGVADDATDGRRIGADLPERQDFGGDGDVPRRRRCGHLRVARQPGTGRLRRNPHHRGLRSSAWRQHCRKICRQHGRTRDLQFLPDQEYSFGAAGDAGAVMTNCDRTAQTVGSPAASTAGRQNIRSISRADAIREWTRSRNRSSVTVPSTGRDERRESRHRGSLSHAGGWPDQLC